MDQQESDPLGIRKNERNSGPVCEEAIDVKRGLMTPGLHSLYYRERMRRRRKKVHFLLLQRQVIDEIFQAAAQMTAANNGL